MAFRHRIVSIVTSPAFQFETNVLTDNVYLTSRELSARIPLLHPWLFICNNSTTEDELKVLGIVSETFHH